MHNYARDIQRYARDIQGYIMICKGFNDIIKMHIEGFDPSHRDHNIQQYNYNNII